MMITNSFDIEMKEKTEFDYKGFESGFAERLKRSGSLLGKNGALTPLIKHLLESALEGELDAHLEDEGSPNRRNGKGRKTVKTPHGPVSIRTPRDRNGSFEPVLLPKRQTVLGVDLDRLVLAMYSHGSSYEDICAHLREMYDLDISPATLTRVTDQVWGAVQQWQTRPLESVYTFVWMDAIHVKIRQGGRVRRRAVYCVIGLNRDGVKELMGMYIGENEGAKFWLQVLSDLRDRGVEDFLVASIDNLKGFAEAIEAVFPQTIVQLCLVHQVRNSLRYVSHNDEKELVRDMKAIYKANTKLEAERFLQDFETRWGDQYPNVIKSWKTNWDRLSAFFEFDPEIRRIIYTTNIIEGFHRQLRKVLKTKGAFTNEEALFKLLYLVQNRITKKWTNPAWRWKKIMTKLRIVFGERLQLPY
jgi:transposase-like protein